MHFYTERYIYWQLLNTSMRLPSLGGSGPIFSMNPRLAAVRPQRRKFRLGNVLLPFALLFTCGGIAYTLKWNRERVEEGPCIDCARRKEIVEEIYFNKRPTVHSGSRL